MTQQYHSHPRRLVVRITPTVLILFGVALKQSSKFTLKARSLPPVPIRDGPPEWVRDGVERRLAPALNELQFMFGCAVGEWHELESPFVDRIHEGAKLLIGGPLCPGH